MKHGLLLLLRCGGVLLAGCAVSGQPSQEGKDFPGTKHHIRADDLPKPFHTRSADNPPQLVPRPNGKLPDTPAGFRVNVFAENLGGENSPRLMAVAPNGDVFVSESGDHRVTVLRDDNNDGMAEKRFVFAAKEDGLELPFGLAFHRGWLYVANTNNVVRFAYREGDTRRTSSPETIISGIPGRGYRQHWTRDIVFSPDGRKLYLSVGSEHNLAEEPPMRAAIHEFNPDGSGKRRFAWGIRNPVGLAFNPATRELWATCNERDTIGDDLVPDYFTSVKNDGFYGWPYFYIGKNPEPRMQGKGSELANRVIVPEVLFQSHSAALGCVFYQGRQFPQEYWNDAFVAFHGSWNRALRTGYKVVRVRFKNGKPMGGYEDFLTGFMTDSKERNVWGRPVGVAVAKDGSLLVSDDGGHRIWRVSFQVRIMRVTRVRPDPMVQGLPFIRQWKGAYSGARTAERKVIRTQSEWQAAWKKAQGAVSPRPALPEVDFSQQMVIAAFMGQKNTGGYSIEITKVVRSATGVKVFVREVAPGPGTITTQALTQPFHIIIAPKVEGTATFESQ